jgi:hypothetical protein
MNEMDGKTNSSLADEEINKEMEINSWNSFKNTLLNVNEKDKCDIMLFLQDMFKKYKPYKTYNCGELFYRARIVDDRDHKRVVRENHDAIYKGYSKEESNAPCPEKATAGRCNVDRNPVLYMAKDKYTALAEVLPAKHQDVSIAKFALLTEVSIIHFEFSENPSIRRVLNNLAREFYFVKAIAENYKITQVLADCIKELGYDGIEYSSSQSETGVNVCLFDPKKAEAKDSNIFIATAVLYYGRNRRASCETEIRLVPNKIKQVFSKGDIDWFIEKINPGVSNKNTSYE